MFGGKCDGSPRWLTTCWLLLNLGDRGGTTLSKRTWPFPTSYQGHMSTQARPRFLLRKRSPSCCSASTRQWRSVHTIEVGAHASSRCNALRQPWGSSSASATCFASACTNSRPALARRYGKSCHGSAHRFGSVPLICTSIQTRLPGAYYVWSLGNVGWVYQTSRFQTAVNLRCSYSNST